MDVAMIRLRMNSTHGYHGAWNNNKIICGQVMGTAGIQSVNGYVRMTITSLYLLGTTTTKPTYTYPTFYRAL